MTAHTLFVTGTDTGVGKTTVACDLIRRARAAGLHVCGMKPVASGCEPTAEGLRNADALALQKAGGTQEPYPLINPYAFEPAIAPHLAARAAGAKIDTAVLDRAHDELAARYDLIVVEGAGGWLVPLDDRSTFAKWVAERDWPVVMVVGMRLGCLNHALLTADAVVHRARLGGWVANVLPPPQPAWEENLADLERRLPAPLLGVLEPQPGRGAIEVAWRHALQPLLQGAAVSKG